MSFLYKVLTEEEIKKISRDDGYDEGFDEGVSFVAAKMKADGKSIEDIVKYTGLSKEEVEKL